jgi:hypothetical protein
MVCRASAQVPAELVFELPVHVMEGTPKEGGPCVPVCGRFGFLFFLVLEWKSGPRPYYLLGRRFHHSVILLPLVFFFYWNHSDKHSPGLAPLKKIRLSMAAFSSSGVTLRAGFMGRRSSIMR